MEIKREKNSEGCYDYRLIDGSRKLDILFAGNLDLYMALGNGRMIPDDANVFINFDITKENYEIYSLFDNLYNEIVDGKVFIRDEADEFLEDITGYSYGEFDYKDTYAYKELVDKDGSIKWISDDGPREVEDSVHIFRLNDDVIRLSFYRNDLPMDFGFKSSSRIIVRFRNSGSYYDPFNCVFMRMYNNLQKVDPKYHQIHMEELGYVKKLEK